jgi:type I restriction enzyme S subunit
LCWWLISQYNHLRSISDSGGGTKGALTCEDIANLRIGLPPLDEQNAIHAFIRRETRKLDLLKEATQRTIKLLQERRTALISAAVTGQISVESLKPKAEADHAN